MTLYVYIGLETAETGVEGQGLGGGICSEMPATQANQDWVYLDEQGSGRESGHHIIKGDGIPTAV